MFKHPLLLKVQTLIFGHKIISAVLAVLIIYVGYGWIGNNNEVETRYIIGIATKETIVSSISGSGQVSASTQIELKPKASGDVVYLGVSTGQEVKAGTVIAQLDSGDALKNVRDAQANLESAQISFAKLVRGADNLSLTQQENTLARAVQSKENAVSNLSSAYENGFNTISNTFLDLPTVMTGLQDLLFGTNQAFDINVQNIDYYASTIYRYDDIASKTYRDDAYNKYQKARAAYDKNFTDYKNISRLSSTSSIEALVGQTYDTTRYIADAIKSASNLIQLSKDKLTEHNIKTVSLVDTHLATLNTYTKNTNTYLGNLLSVVDAIKTNRDAMVNAERTIIEQTQSLQKLKIGADALDIQSSQLSVTQRENALRDAQENLADYVVRAPFDGTIAKLSVKKGDPASSGTAVAILITKQKIAEISLNEVDVAKIKVGQKSTLTFDAIEGLTISGQVSEVDTIGTVSQGVVTYGVKISFDTQDDRVKSGMSVSSSVITDVKQDVIAVPLVAVRTQGDASFVDVVSKDIAVSEGNQGTLLMRSPESRAVTVGLSNDTSIEILSGLVEGERIVIRTVTAATASTQSAPSIFGAATNNRTTGSGAAFRMMR